MRIKPTSAQPLRVYSVRHVWRGMFAVLWTDLLNYPRTFETLYRKVEGQWTSGEAHPTGVYGSYLRPADPIIAAALDRA